MTRREFLPTIAAFSAAAGTAARALGKASNLKDPAAFEEKPNFGRLKQSVCSSVFGRGMPFEEQCRRLPNSAFRVSTCKRRRNGLC